MLETDDVQCAVAEIKPCSNGLRYLYDVEEGGELGEDHHLVAASSLP